jgi:ABC-2 type transport system ATP-binding protein
VLQVSSLTKRFGDLIAVDGLTFQVYRGEVFGFLGPNGAGKTTTINMICGLLPPTRGEILIYGCETWKKKEIKTQIGYCAQENILWPQLTCLEQLVFMGKMYGIPGKVVHKKAWELLELMVLEEKAHVLAKILSGGMKRRLNICLALIHDPNILILDEPEAGLDPQSRVLVRNFIKNLKKEKTVILTTHNMDEADRLSDRVAIIDYGKLLLTDTPTNLKKSIGEGDILKVELNGDENIISGQLIQELSKICDQVKTSGNTLILKSRNIIELVNDINLKVREKDLQVKEITLRENTLEDVFIHLTGRKLRQ